MRRVLFIVLTIVLTVFTSNATTAQAQVPCPESPTSYRDLIACAETRATEVLTAQADVAVARAKMKSAAQLPNPELTSNSVFGRNESETSSEVDLALGFPIELGGKRGLRQSVAASEIRFAEASLFDARANLRSRVFLKLHRLRQALHELEIIDEAVGTFSKLISQYASRPGLSPEQQVTISVFQLSKSDYELKRTTTTEEINGLLADLTLVSAIPSETIKKLLPPTPKAWPKLDSSSSTTSSPRLLALQAARETSMAQIREAQSQIWPTVILGPSVKLQNEGGRNSQLYGFNLSLPLPLFNRNEGAREEAAAQLARAERSLELGSRELGLRKTLLTAQYESSIHALSGSLSHAEIERRHDAAEKHFSRGMVPSSLVIEAHRASYDLEKARHERELKAFETLLEIRTLEGTILEVAL